MLPAACAIIILVFTARRKSEVETLQDDCLLTDDGGRAWLNTWIAKTIMDFDQIPIPQSVVKAVEVLLDLSESARKAGAGTGWIFDFLDPSTNRRTCFDIRTAIHLFVDYIDVPPTEDGPWTVTPHQFRRFFAYIYHYHYKYASLTALSFFLRHFDEEMTRRYVTEETHGDMLVEKELADARRRELEALRERSAAGIVDLRIVSERAAATGEAMAARAQEEEGQRKELYERLAEIAHKRAVSRFGGFEAEVERLSIEARKQVEIAPAGSAIALDDFSSLLMGLAFGHRGRESST
jgi:hypothetical protein